MSSAADENVLLFDKSLALLGFYLMKLSRHVTNDAFKVQNQSTKAESVGG